MDKWKRVALEDEEERLPYCVEAGGFIASVRGYVAQRLATTRHQEAGAPSTFAMEVPLKDEGLDL